MTIVEPIAPAAPTKTDVAPISEADIEAFIKEMSEFDDIKCEYVHKGTNCTKTITHRATDCKITIRICTQAAMLIEVSKHSGKVCKFCNRKALECWKVYPI
jgi:hypothetical protein